MSLWRKMKRWLFEKTHLQCPECGQRGHIYPDVPTHRCHSDVCQGYTKVWME